MCYVTTGRPSRSPAGSRRRSCRPGAAGETGAVRRPISNGLPLRPPWRRRLTWTAQRRWLTREVVDAFWARAPRGGAAAIRSGPVTVGRTRNWYPRQNRIASACLSQTPLFGRISLGVDLPREACWLWAPGEPVANLRYDRLHALRHRGRESAGMAVVDGYSMPVYNMPVYKKMGLVRQVLDKATLARHE